MASQFHPSQWPRTSTFRAAPLRGGKASLITATADQTTASQCIAPAKQIRSQLGRRDPNHSTPMLRHGAPTQSQAQAMRPNSPRRLSTAIQTFATATRGLPSRTNGSAHLPIPAHWQPKARPSKAALWHGKPSHDLATAQPFSAHSCTTLQRLSTANQNDAGRRKGTATAPLTPRNATQKGRIKSC